MESPRTAIPFRLSKWVREKLPSNKKEKPLPTLSSPRPCVLTPSTSCESVNAPVTSPQQSTFFARLPGEIRHQILLEAFGNVILHMDLRMEHPTVRSKNGVSNNSPHCRSLVPAKAKKEKEKLDRGKPKEWQWWSCVCHRAPPGRTGFRAHGRVFTEPFEDECRQGNDDWCEFWPGDKPGKCRIGVVGWFLSCKQAYLETIDVLYASNTIFMASTTMVLNLPNILLPQRLASITAVEMLWHVHPLRDALPRDPPDSDLSTFQSLLDALPRTFPSLNKLYISLQGKSACKQWTGSYDEILHKTESVIMHPIDTMVRKMGPKLQECIIALPLPLYNPRRFKIRGDIVEAGWKMSPNIERLWRQLPRTSTGEGEHLDGFWVCLGQTDSFRISYEVYCFGSSAMKSTPQIEETKVYNDFRLEDA